ncbi:ankyrin repeat protein [Ancylostoma ceylanicum]|uniref:Ankyrin repeat protein n=1 Tax=Ancylostoma ceylanicum TaxID=53326 RepID=A0A0D6LML9_9BILA|nr:ankyrin repeat protein [Ancylostoma ceylanicum]
MNMIQHNRSDCIDVVDKRGMSAFLCAVSIDALDTVKMLVEKNANILLTDSEGRNAVFIGAKFNAINVLTYLLEIYRPQKTEKGAFYPDMVDQEDYNQDTPMHLVCHNGYLEVVTLLHEYGARLDLMDGDERISLHRAASEGQTAIGKHLCITELKCRFATLCLRPSIIDIFECSTNDEFRQSSRAKKRASFLHDSSFKVECELIDMSILGAFGYLLMVSTLYFGCDFIFARVTSEFGPCAI